MDYRNPFAGAMAEVGRDILLKIICGFDIHANRWVECVMNYRWYNAAMLHQAEGSMPSGRHTRGVGAYSGLVHSQTGITGHVRNSAVTSMAGVRWKRELDKEKPRRAFMQTLLGPGPGIGLDDWREH